MNRVTKIIAGIACLGALASGCVLVISHGGHQLPSNVFGMPHSRFELMPATSTEFSERHFPGVDGLDMSVDVDYRDHSRGLRLYRPQAPRTLAQETRVSERGEDLLKAQVASDGKLVLNGFERLETGGFIWKAFTTGDGISHKQLYWSDGKTLFADEQQKPGDKFKDITFYYKNSGKRWLHFVGAVDIRGLKYMAFGSDKLVSAQAWAESGNMLLDVQMGPDAPHVYTFYRPDGTRSYAQARAPFERCSDHGYYCGISFGVSKLTLYSADGKRVERTVDVAPGYEIHPYPKYTDFDEQGGYKVFTLDDREHPVHVAEYGANGALIGDHEITGSSDAFVLDYNLLLPPELPDPIAPWLKERPPTVSDFAQL